MILYARENSRDTGWRRQQQQPAAKEYEKLEIAYVIDNIYLFIYFQFQIKIITRCQCLKEKHLQTPLKTKIKATQQA